MTLNAPSQYRGSRGRREKGAELFGKILAKSTQVFGKFQQ